MNRVMWHGCATLLRAVQQEELSTVEIAQLLGVSMNMTRVTVNRLNDLGLIYIARWVAADRPGPCIRMWRYGGGPNAADPGRYSVRPRKPGRASKRSTLISFAYIMRALGTPVSIAELAEQTGGAHGRLRQLMAYCREIGLVRIAEWHKRDGMGGSPTCLFALGSEPDEPRPKRISNKVARDRYRSGRRAKAEQLNICHALAGVRYSPMQVTA